MSFNSFMLTPSIYISPLVGVISLFNIFKVVVFPQPDSPINVTSSPSSIVKEISSRMVLLLYFLLTSFNSIITSLSLILIIQSKEKNVLGNTLFLLKMDRFCHIFVFIYYLYNLYKFLLKNRKYSLVL